MSDANEPEVPSGDSQFPAELHLEKRWASLLVGFDQVDTDEGERELMLRSRVDLLVTMDHDEAIDIVKQLVDCLAGDNSDTPQIYLRGLLEVEKRDDLPDLEAAAAEDEPNDRDWRDNPEALVPIALQQVEPGLWVFNHDNPENPPLLLRRLLFMQPQEDSQIHEFSVAGRQLIKSTPVRMLLLVGGLDPWWGARFNHRIEPGEVVRLRCSDFEGHMMVLCSAAPMQLAAKEVEP